MQKIANLKGFTYAAVSSSTFGLAPFFSIRLLNEGLSPFEVLSYRWGTASLALLAFGLLTGVRFHVDRRNLGVVFLLSLLRATTSLSLVFAYANIASGVASIIHFMYPLAVAMAMMLFFKERPSLGILTAIAVSIAGAAMLSSGDIVSRDGNVAVGIVCACISVFSYAGYIVGVRKTRAADVESTTLTLAVMAAGAVLFACGGALTSGVRLVTDGGLWLDILGLGIVATAVSNMALVKSIKAVGPTLTSVLGAMEPLVAVMLGIICFGERLTAVGAAGIVLIVAGVTIVVVRRNRNGGR